MSNLNDALGTFAEMDTAAGKVGWYSLEKLEEQGAGAVSRLPYSIKVLLEAALRQCDGFQVREEDVLSLAAKFVPAFCQSAIPPAASTRPSPSRVNRWPVSYTHLTLPTILLV